MNKSDIILASASPRRVELLQQIEVKFEQCVADIDETPRLGEAPGQFVCRLAEEKAQSVFEKSSKELPVLGSDTIVVVDEHILGKPDDYQHAVDMLKLLSGRKHQVMTAVTLFSAEQQKTMMNTSEVRFMDLSQDLIDAYWQTGESVGKAGAYAVQGIAAQFIIEIKGSYSSIMGLPLYEVRCLLEAFGIDVLGNKK